jgi:hypothetical protein
MDELLKILGFLNQLGAQLQTDYTEIKESIKNCI